MMNLFHAAVPALLLMTGPQNTPRQNLANRHTVGVNIEAIPGDAKTVHVTLWSSSDGFPFQPLKNAVVATQVIEVPAIENGKEPSPGQSTVKLAFDGVLEGSDYALTAWCDMDGGKSLDLDYQGKPLEPFGSSARTRGWSTFRASRFSVLKDVTRSVVLGKPRETKDCLDLTVTASRAERIKGSMCFVLWSDGGGFPIDLKGKGVVATQRVEVNRSVVTAGGEVKALFRAVPRGTYAVTVFHDLDGDGKVDRNFFGKPTEPVGLSKNPPRRPARPEFKPSAVSLAQDTDLRVNIR
ncbi:MAG: DUF2141 domain-containing protein [Planctomycetota bacterium]